MRATLEFRVCWQRVGMRKRAAIFQTEAGAREKVERLVTSDEMKGITGEYGELPWGSEEMPDLIGTPVIERRQVGPWGTVMRKALE